MHQTAGVWIDTAVLAPLPPREYRSGLAEVVKYGGILEAEFFAYLEESADALLARDPHAVRCIVARCCELKARIVEQDERDETGQRAVLNYGHTFAHAFEPAAGYVGGLHRGAGAAGIVCDGLLAGRRGLIPGEVQHLHGRRLVGVAL